MAKFPDEVLTRTRKGEIEVRSLVDRGRYVRYRYLHPETGEPMEGGKVKLVLISNTGRAEEYFIIPTKSSRDLLIPAAEKGERKIWDGTQAIDLRTPNLYAPSFLSSLSWRRSAAPSRSSPAPCSS